MEKETTVTDTSPQLPNVPAGTDAPAVRTIPLDEVRKLIRKVSKDHEGLLRRLAK